MKIDFEFETEYGIFKDALHFDDARSLPEQDVIDLMKKQRLDNWLNIISASSNAVVEPVTE